MVHLPSAPTWTGTAWQVGRRVGRCAGARAGQERGVIMAIEQGRVVQRLNLGLAPGCGGQGEESLRQPPGGMTDKDWEQERETSKTPNSNMWLSFYIYCIYN